MLFPIVLICLTGTPQAQCTRETAYDTVTSVEPSPLPYTCLQNGLFAAAKLSIAQGAGVYTKVVCERRS